MEMRRKMKRMSAREAFAIPLLMLISTGAAQAQELVHVSQAEAMRAATSRVQPEYPAMAKQLHLEGAVEVQAQIGENGSVELVKPLTGNAVLMNAAVAALKRWKFTPFTAAGKPARAIADMSFSFRM